MKEQNSFAPTPEPPYYAVIFTSLRTDVHEDYAETNLKLMELAKEFPGFLGVENARDGLGISISYWDSPESIQAWKEQADHSLAQQRGRREWYTAFKVRIARIERDYDFARD